jgi:hemolysin-activating ACP:hemolysin acyltransferase
MVKLVLETGGAAPILAPGTPAQRSAFTSEDAARLAEMARRIAGTFGEIVALLMRAPQYRYAFLADLEWMVMPAIASGQLVLGEVQHKDSGISAPVAVIMWACVSDEVDARLTASLGTAIRLKPTEWTSGAHTWLVEQVGDAGVVQALIDRAFAGPLKGRTLKVAGKGPDGRPVIQTMRGGVAADDPAPSGVRRPS